MAQLAEASDLKSVSCEFESRWGRSWFASISTSDDS